MSCLPLACGGADLTRPCHTVDLRVDDTTCGSAEVTWSIWAVTWEDNERGVVPLPWSSTRELCDADIDLAARRSCNDDGTVTVEIYVDGALHLSRASTGPGAIASADYWLD